ncbi:alpha/beta hydrolase-fold protein [Embleya sp. NBC_00888]|uniref:alpha/beta hydrolase n=1 Tax=Embleya sp. NBC_00888 TaxID=2975960 RepID=UPI0038635A67|nr:alpha/beta hydrolase-fold protein [Embleya sp. NBC_00888]
MIHRTEDAAVGLTSLKLIILLGVVAFAAAAAAVYFWPKLSRQGVLPILGRVGILLSTQVLVMATVAVIGNRYFVFYTTWDDLLGHTGKPVVNFGTNGPGDVPKLVKENGTETIDVPQGKNPQAAGQITQVDVAGRRSGLGTPALVYLPPQYFQAQYKDRRFPVVVVLTGYPGNERNLVTRLELPKFAANEIAAGRVQPTIYVMMKPSVGVARDTECTDVPGGPQVGMFFSQDLPEAISQAYRVAPGPRGWGMLGDSTGGYCAAKLAMLHSDRIGAGVALSADYGAPMDGDTGDLYGGSKAYRNQHDLMWRLKNMPMPPVSLLLTSSESGEPNLADTKEFQRLAKPPLKVDTLLLPTGGHNFKTWQAVLPDALRWMSKQQNTDQPKDSAPIAASP